MKTQSRETGTLRAALCAGTVILLAACGGGTGQVAGGGVGGTGISAGAITGFGSIFVNGREYATDTATILLDGSAASESSLSEGMLVRVEGEWRSDETGIASRVEHVTDVRGPVQGTIVFDPLSGDGQLTVLGQTVEFNKKTVFRGAAREAIAVGDDVAVSGWYLGDSRFRASLVRRLGSFIDAGQVGVRGQIEQLDTLSRRFRIGEVEVSYSSATLIDMLDGSNDLLPADNGTFIRVEGSLQGGVLDASRIIQQDSSNPLRAGSSDDVEIEGPISETNPAARTFVIDGVTVRVTNRTEFDDDSRESDLQPGLQVEVEGKWDSSGVLVAGEIELLDDDSEVEARILGIDSVNRTIDVGGVDVRTATRTLIVDEDDDRRLDFGDLRVGDYVEVQGIRRDEAGQGIFLDAIKIERDDDDDDDDFELKGRVDTIEVPFRFQVLGLWLNVDGATEWDDGLDSINDLFVGLQVEVEYRQCGAGFCALEVEREDD